MSERERSVRDVGEALMVAFAAMRSRSLALVLSIGGLGPVMIATACGLDVRGRGPEPVADAASDEARLTPPLDVPDAEPRVDAAADRCPKGPLAPMIEAPSRAFCIDAREVSNAEYGAFVAAMDGGGPDAAALAARPWCLASASPTRPPGDASAQASAAGVSFCDALAFCAWAGKRLCSAGDGGQWSRACTADGTRALPYGEALDGSACNVGRPPAPPSIQAGGASLGCVGGYGGLFDMVGNVAEWVDECAEDGGSCVAAGGLWASPADASCATSTAHAPTQPIEGVGIRCCF